MRDLLHDMDLPAIICDSIHAYTLGLSSVLCGGDRNGTSCSALAYRFVVTFLPLILVLHIENLISMGSLNTRIRNRKRNCAVPRGKLYNKVAGNHMVKCVPC